MRDMRDNISTIMTGHYITLRADMTVEQALTHIRTLAHSQHNLHVCYVTNECGVLIGIVSAKDLILHQPHEVLETFMRHEYIACHADAGKEEVANILVEHDLYAVPILDDDAKILGVVTLDDAVDVIRDEATEDISKMAGMTPNDTPYLQTGVLKIFRGRLPWLLVLLVSATFTGWIINTYERLLSAVSPLLFACIPMLMDTGGNAGSQASVTIIRALAMNEVSFRDFRRVLWQEIRVSLLVATVLSVACFGKLLLIDGLMLGYDYTVAMGLVVAGALFGTVCIAKLVGCCLPMLAKKCHLDPAVVANPFITTTVDAISLMIFCNLALAVL